MTSRARSDRVRRVAVWALVAAALTSAVFLTTRLGKQSGNPRIAAAEHGGRAAPDRITLRNPVLDRDLPDPSVLVTGDDYYVFATGSAGTHVQTTRSRDLVQWTDPVEALAELPAWVSTKAPEIWAPMVVARDGDNVMVFSGRDARTGRHCIGSAVAADPTGPYVPHAEPLLCDAPHGGVIDPYIARIGRTVRLVWKNDGNCCGSGSAIWSQQLDLGALRLEGQAVRLLAVDQPWERSTDARRTTVEAPSMVAVNGRIFLFYSGNGYATPSYAEGYAVCETVEGPCSKPRSTPVLASAGRVAGPGGADAFRDRSGRFLLAYHAWDASAVGYPAGGRRSLRIDPILVDHDLVTVEGPTDAGP